MTALRIRNACPTRASQWRRTPAFLATLAVAVAALALSIAARADDELPARAGRVADVAGALSVAPADRPDQWEPANLNFTVIGGDNLWVAQDGRAEIDYGGGQFRLAGDTSVQVVRLDDRALVLFVAQGTAILRVRVLDSGDVAQVDTPNAQIHIARPGLYRIDVLTGRAQTVLQVRDGEADVVTPTESARALPGQTADVQGSDTARVDVRIAGFTDALDGWSASRDQFYDQSAATYVSRQMVGYADLDTYGTWQRYPEYGSVWFPTAVVADWAPYRFGRWAWIGGFGWTWVDDAPWGYAPFHYGRWAYIGGRWGWCPGGWVARPAWAPALVAWYGGPSWSFSVSTGGPMYGWVPLGWGEPYIPAWGACAGRCWTAYNRPYAVRYAERPSVPPTRFVNQGAPGGFTVVNRDALVGGQRVSRAVVAVPPPAASRAPVLGAAPPDVRPAPGRIPGARPGGREPPPAASTFYPTQRASRPIGAVPAAPAAPAVIGAPGTGATAGRPARDLAVPPADTGPAGRGARTSRPAGELPAPARTPPGLEGAPATRSSSGQAGMAPVVPHAGTASVPSQPAGAATRAPARRGEPVAPAPSAGAPATPAATPAAPAAAPAPVRPARSMPPQGVQVPPGSSAPALPSAPAQTPAPHSRAAGAVPAAPRMPQGQGVAPAPGGAQPPSPQIQQQHQQPPPQQHQRQAPQQQQPQAPQQQQPQAPAPGGAARPARPSGQGRSPAPPDSDATRPERTR